MENSNVQILGSMPQANLPQDDSERTDERDEARGQMRILAIVPALAALAAAIYFLVQ